MELHFNSQVRETKENLSKCRRRNILYLVRSYLQEEGLFEAASTVWREAKLSNDYDLCDNIDLNIIFQEFVNYYFIKFDKYPTICKKKDPEIAANTKNQAKSKKKESVQTKTTEDSKDSNLANSISISTFKNDVEKPTKNEEHFKQLCENRPFSKFLSKALPEIQPVLEQIYSESKCRSTNVSWNNIVGLENVKELLKEAIVYPDVYPKLFENLETWKAILLYGPPGSGKTLLAKAVSNECSRMFINISPSLILSKWRGESEKIIKSIFDLARYYSPSIIFVDEIDSLCSKRGCFMEHEASLRLKNEILTEIDGLNENSSSVFFLATSNSPWNIDRAMLRRMEKRIHVPLPDEVERKLLFQNYCKEKTKKETISFSELAKITEGYSGADIAIICKEAIMHSIRQAINTSDGKDCLKDIISMEAFHEAIIKTKPSVKDLHTKYATWAETMGAE